MNAYTYIYMSFYRNRQKETEEQVDTDKETDEKRKKYSSVLKQIETDKSNR